MDTFDLYKDIQCRTNGEIYLGVVGPVRSGKSTFIKRFMDVLVLPKMTDEACKRADGGWTFRSLRREEHHDNGAEICAKRSCRNPARKGCECAGASDRLCGLYGGGSRRLTWKMEQNVW